MRSVSLFTLILSVFLKVNGKKIINGNFKSSLVLKGLNEKSLHIFLATRPNIKSIEFVEPENKEQQAHQNGFIEQQRNKLKNFYISVSSFSLEKVIKRERGLSLGF